MNFKKTAVTTFAATLLIGSSIPSTQAFFGDFFGKKEGKPRMEMMKKGDMKMKMKQAQASPEVQALIEDLKAAREDGDEERVTQLREQLEVLHKAEMEQKEAAMEAALTGGYDTWKAHATEQGVPEEILEKVTAENFATFVEIHNTRKKLRELEESLGIKGFEGPHVFMMKK
ncbi:MAG: hypothetical protein AB7J40_05740 [Candidatus Altimarinota bacterium]